MKNKKLLCTVLAVLLMISFIFSACTDDEKLSASSEGTASKEENSINELYGKPKLSELSDEALAEYLTNSGIDFSKYNAEDLNKIRILIRQSESNLETPVITVSAQELVDACIKLHNVIRQYYGLPPKDYNFSTAPDSSEETAENTAVIYTVDSDNGRLDKKMVITNGEPRDIVDALIENGSLPEGVVLNSFSYEGITGRIDMNKVYGDAVCSGTYAEWKYISVLINSFLESYKLEQIWLTVDGETLVTGHHGSFDYALGYQENLV